MDNQADKSYFERFSQAGKLQGEHSRITNEHSVANYQRRDEGLNVLLVHVPIREWSYPNIMPIGEGYVASVAVMDGHGVHVLDLNAEREKPIESETILRNWMSRRIEEKLKECAPDVIGFGGIITQYKTIKEAIGLCKKAAPNAKIVLGGGIASCAPKFMLERIGADIVVLEEGELTFSEVLFRLEKSLDLKNLPGIGYKIGNEIILNSLRPSVIKGKQGLDGIPWPLRSYWRLDDVYSVNPVGHLNWEAKWDDGRNLSGKKSLSILASRGCPYAKSACDYCYASYLGERYRLRSPSDVVEEMVFLKERYGVDYIHFLDDLLMTDWRWVLDFCDQLEKMNKERGFSIEWGGSCRSNIVADDVLRAQKQGRQNFVERSKEVGLVHIGFGLETASPKILKTIDKSGQTVEKMEVAVAEVQRVLGYVDCSFIVGSPGETTETVSETVEFCKRTNLRPEVFFYTTAYPATKFWELAVANGLITKSVTGVADVVTDDIIEQYFLLLGEQGSHVRTNFSDLEDDAILQLARWAVDELNPTETKFKREPHSGDRFPSITDASRATV